MTEEQIQRVQAAHTELAKALGDIQKSHPPPKIARAISLSITNAEQSHLWFRSAVQDFNSDGTPT